MCEYYMKEDIKITHQEFHKHRDLLYSILLTDTIIIGQERQ